MQIAQAKRPHRNDSDSCRRSFERELPLARTRSSRGGHQPPESLLYSMDSAYPLSINKIGNGGERKEREKEVFIEEALHRTNEDPEEWVWAFEKMKMQRVKKKSFMNNRPLRADGDSRTGKRGTRHLLNNTKNKAIPCPREKQEAWHEIRGGKNSDSELRMEGRTK